MILKNVCFLDWYYGSNIRTQHIKGIFPKCCVYLRDVFTLKSGYVSVVYKTTHAANINCCSHSAFVMKLTFLYLI